MFELNIFSFLWAVPVLPLFGFVLNSLFGRHLNQRLVAIIATSMVGLSFLLSVNLFSHMLASGAFKQSLYTWAVLGDVSIQINLSFNQLSGLLVLIITGISTLIHAYSIGYMHGSAYYTRFFSFLNLFVFFMLILVLADNLLLVFVGWEGVGLCSYLLIGFEFQRPAAEKAARYAFILNRVGDLGFMVAMLLSLYFFNTLDLESLNQQALGGDPQAIEWLALALLLAATGKSAQIPLYTWLPDAMEGPTPVSALIHAATMVTAGIYLISQLSYLFAAAPWVSNLIMLIGGTTALVAGFSACFQADIKKVLAYSTISQLGYMFLALGAGAFSAALFHLLTHAFFKALLFLAAGALIHSVHRQNLFEMGCLKSKHWLIWFSFAVGSWAISGLPLAAGFFSKDLILAAVFAKSPFWWLVGLFTAFLTAFYMYRLVNLAFYAGDNKNNTPEEPAAPTPWSMQAVLIILIMGSLSAGYLSIPTSFGLGVQNVWHAFFEGYFATSAIPLNSNTEHSLTFLATLMAILGLGCATFLYRTSSQKPVWGRSLMIKTQLILNQVGLDKNYWRFATLVKFTSKYILQGLTEPFLKLCFMSHSLAPLVFGEVVRRLQTGNVRHYFLFSVFAMLVLISLISILN